MARLDGNLRLMALVRLLFWTHLLSSVTVPFFRDWGGLSFTEILLLQAWFMVWSFLLEVPTGAVADRLGRRVSIAAGAFLASAGSLVYASFPSIWVFMLAEILYAAAYALCSGADEALVYDTLAALGRQGEASRTMARLESFKLAGILAGALTGSFVAAWLGLRAPMLLLFSPFPGKLQPSFRRSSAVGASNEEKIADVRIFYRNLSQITVNCIEDGNQPVTCVPVGPESPYETSHPSIPHAWNNGQSTNDHHSGSAPVGVEVSGQWHQPGNRLERKQLPRYRLGQRTSATGLWRWRRSDHRFLRRKCQ